MNSANHVTGGILVGGRSTRMGQDKADVLVGDKTMLEMVADAVGSVTDQLVLLGPDRDGWESWPDAVHVQGPLAGMATALQRTSRDHVLLVAVDHPFVTGATLGRLASLGGDVPCVPVDQHGVRQVTCALYPASVAEAAVEEAISAGSIQSLLDRVSFLPVEPETWQAWGEDGRSWFSADDPDSLNEGRALYTPETTADSEPTKTPRTLRDIREDHEG